MLEQVATALPGSAPWASLSLLWLYLATVVVLSIFGIHRMVLLGLYLRHRQAAFPTPLPLADLQCPEVLVQLPIYNEPQVVERLIDSVAALDWPRDRLRIQILDDSNDETPKRIQRVLESLEGSGIQFEHQRRGNRQGYKAGALAEGLLAAPTAPFVAVFDADFVVPPDFLRRAVPPLLADSGVGMVQARWGHLNRDDSELTQIQAILLDGHFILEHGSRFRSGRFFNFNGTAGVWRRQAIEEGGGWQGDTLCEDLDLSYRSQLAGWRFTYLQDLVVPAELPGDAASFKSQQQRWAQGAIQVAAKLLPRIWCTPLPWRIRIEATVHLLGNLAFLPMVLLIFLLPLAATIRNTTSIAAIELLDFPLFVAATLNLAIFYLFAQREARGPRTFWRSLPRIPLVLGVGAALSLNNLRAVFRALCGAQTPFVRTPKHGEGPRIQKAGPRLDLQSLVESLFGVYLLLATGGLLAWHGWSHSLPFLALFGFSFLHLGLRDRRAQSVARFS